MIWFRGVFPHLCLLPSSQATVGIGHGFLAFAFLSLVNSFCVVSRDVLSLFNCSQTPLQDKKRYHPAQRNSAIPHHAWKGKESRAGWSVGRCSSILIGKTLEGMEYSYNLSIHIYTYVYVWLLKLHICFEPRIFPWFHSFSFDLNSLPSIWKRASWTVHSVHIRPIDSSGLKHNKWKPRDM